MYKYRAPTVFGAAHRAAVDEAPEPVTPSSRRSIVRYLGFRSTAAGREYTMSVTDAVSSRAFVLCIAHQSFAAREARFQDAPDVCSAVLRRELAAHPDLLPAEDMQVTSQDLLDYRTSHLTSLEKRARGKS